MGAYRLSLFEHSTAFHVGDPSLSSGTVVAGSGCAPGAGALQRGAATADAVFQAQAAATPDAPAMIYRDATFSYAVLDAAVEQLAARLAQRGVRPEHVVALALPRSPGMVVGMLATLRAGGAYLPLDLSHPPARNGFLILDSGACLLVTAPDSAGLPSGIGPLPRLAIDPSDGCLTAPEPAPCWQRPMVHPDNLAAMMYTSGSTGTPKAVAVTHGNIAAFAARPEFVPMGPGQRVLHLGSPAFDVATFEILAPLLSGACVVIAPQGALDLDELTALVVATRVDTVWLTSGLLRHIAEAQPGFFLHLRSLLAGGEVVPPPSVRRVVAAAPGITVINGYGPTETTTFASTHRVAPDDLERDNIPIGRAIRGTRLYILDDRLEPVAPGETGMLYIVGDGLTRGYAGRPGLTAERFLPCPFGPPGARMYMSGDLARQRADGAVEYQGRADQQVKLRGLRIEPGEIEAALLACPAIAQAVVAPRAIAGDTRLIAWVVTRPGHRTPDHAMLRDMLATKLPDYMVPAAFVAIDRLPLTAAGKVDRASLPTPTPADDAHVPPVGDTETMVAREFAALTGARSVGRHADFFALGGNSLLAMRLVARLRAATSVAVPLAAVFRGPSPAALALLLRPTPAGAPAWSPLLPLRRDGTARPLFCVHPATGSAAGFRPLADALGPRHPVWGLQARGLDNDEPPHMTIAEMAESYVAAIRSVQSHGPYVLLGWSLGGIIAQAMACRLESDGEQVAMAVVLDSPTPSVAATDPTGDQRFATDLLVRMAARDPAGRARRARLLHAAAVRRGIIPPAAPEEWGELLLRQVGLSTARLRDHRAAVCRAPLLLFRAAPNGIPAHDDNFRWEPLTTGGVHIATLACGHNGMLDPPAAAQIAARVRPFLP